MIKNSKQDGTFPAGMGRVRPHGGVHEEAAEAAASSQALVVAQSAPLPVLE